MDRAKAKARKDLEGKVESLNKRIERLEFKRDDALTTELSSDVVTRIDQQIAFLEATKAELEEEIAKLSPGMSERLPKQEAYLNVLQVVAEKFVSDGLLERWQAEGRPLGKRLASLLTLDPGSVIALPDQTLFLGSTNLKSAIWIHPDYPLLLQAVLEAMVPNHRVYVMGTPGVGKTFSGGLLVSFLLLLGFTVIYENRLVNEVKSSVSWWLKLGEEPKLTYDLAEWVRPALQREGELVYVVDGGSASLPMEGPGYPFPAVVFTSPKPMRDLRKNPGQPIFYMYAWQLEHLIACRDAFPEYHRVSKADIGSLYKIAGGVPRKVFTGSLFAKPSPLAALKDLQEAVKRIPQHDMGLVVLALGSGSAPDLSDRLLHLKPPIDRTAKPFREFVVWWSSPIAEQLYAAEWGARNFLEACQTVWEHQPQKSKLYGGLLGGLAEAIVHTVLSQGGEWRAVRLQEEAFDPQVPQESKVLRVPRMSRFWFATLADLQEHFHKPQVERCLAPTYVQPYSSCFPGLDSLYLTEEQELLGTKPVPVLRLLQVTKAFQHSLHLVTVQRVLLSCGYDPEKQEPFKVEILFVVTPEAFEDGFVTTQSFTHQGKKVEEEDDDAASSLGRMGQAEVEMNDDDMEEEEAEEGVRGYDFSGQSTPSWLLEIPQYVVAIDELSLLAGMQKVPMRVGDVRKALEEVSPHED
eukprot:TRINITY_DN18972_c0_g1_i1.p1 TRINITY_DN18972_c0_g1~~TRINITY_DN18972_c0_g1_i1.p1  ORF type:complete len:691 (-),score=115.61 TRINITY_DN18972_c0_g1_i1:650-2722(-)